jgi:hypothetical protein
MATSPPIKSFLRTATFDLALLQLDRTHRVAGEARTALVGILAVDVAALIGLVAVVATIAAGGQVPVRWWVPGVPLIVSLGVAVHAVLPRWETTHELDYGTAAGKALDASSDRAAVDSLFADLEGASRRALSVANGLERRAALAMGLFLLGFALTLVPIGLDFARVFPP